MSQSFFGLSLLLLEYIELHIPGFQLRLLKLAAYARESLFEPDEQLRRPGRCAREQIKSYQQEENSLENGEKETEYAEKDESPSGKLKRQPFEPFFHSQLVYQTGLRK